MKRIENKKLEFFLASIIEFAEFTIMGIIGYFAFKVSIENILIILLIFFISRFTIKKPQHYKIVTYFDGGWRSCVTWTTAIILSMFLASHISIQVGCLFTVFSVFIISTKGNIDDLTMGFKARKEDGKYYDIEEYIKYTMNFIQDEDAKPDKVFIYYTEIPQ